MSQGEAPKPLKNWELGDPVPHAWWPKVADTVIEALLATRSCTWALRIMDLDLSQAVYIT
jgi:hypothetical protein